MMSVITGTNSIILSEEQEECAGQLHRNSCMVDSLGSVLNPLAGDELSKEFTDKVETMLAAGFASYFVMKELWKMQFERLLRDEKYQQSYINGVQNAGVNVLSHTVFPISQVSSAFEVAAMEISRLKTLFRAFDFLMEVDTSSDVEEAQSRNKLGIILNFQNAWQLTFQDDPSKLELFYNMGIHIIQLTYNMLSNIGSGCTERTDAGLSRLGLQLVEKMNELGMIVDLSHCGYKTSMDAIEASSEPVAFTHTACRGVYDHDRGKTDEQIRAVAQSGGYIGIVAVPYFLRQSDEVTLSDMLDHIDYAVALAGIDHVGIGGDWPGRWYPESLAAKHNEECESATQMTVNGFGPEQHVDTRMTLGGFEDWTKFPNITGGLISRGYSDDEVQKILGENFLRLFKKVVG